MQAQICTSQIQITRMPFCLRLDEIVRWIKCVFYHLKTVQRPQIYRYLFNSFERLQYQYGLIDKVAHMKETIVFKSVWILTMQQQSKFSQIWEAWKQNWPYSLGRRNCSQLPSLSIRATIGEGREQFPIKEVTLHCNAANAAVFKKQTNKKTSCWLHVSRKKHMFGSLYRAELWNDNLKCFIPPKSQQSAKSDIKLVKKLFQWLSV